ncbi:tetratricopeptide-like helical domain containing protein [Tanacetum coccineum]
MFCKAIMKLYGEEFLRNPTYTIMEKLYTYHEEKHGFPGMLGSIDCTDWPWANCPVAYRAQFCKGDHGPDPFILLEVILSNDLWIWHAFLEAIVPIFPEEQHRDDDPVRTHEESVQVTQETINRTGHLSSGPIHASLLTGSPKISLPLRHGSFSETDKPEMSPLRHPSLNRRIIRATSEPQAIIRLKSIGVGSQMLPEVEEDLVSDNDDVIGCIASVKFAEKCFDSMSWTPESGIGGNGSGRDYGGYGSGRSNNDNDNDNEQKKIGAHYQKMLKSNPNDPLLLRNYGKFLHEVEGDVVKAEECYGRAILASPADGELLSFYGKLIWDTERDGERAQSYFDRAVSVSPDNCMVMGSYAQFMWEAEEEDDETNEDESGSKVSIPVLAVF